MNLGLILALGLLAVWLIVRYARISYTVAVSQTLPAPVKRVVEAIEDFEQWPLWSPWLLHDPNASLQFDRPRKLGGSYSWQGRRIGAGRITHSARPDPHTLHMQLQFLRPFKASAKACFEVQAQGDPQSQVRWSMSGKLPIFLLAMKATLQDLMRKDFELGLARLAGVLNPQAPHPRIEFAELAERASFHALSQRQTTTLQALPQVFAQAMPMLKAQAGDACTQPPLGVYHRIDAKTGAVDLEVAYPVAADHPGATLVRGGHYFRVILKGDYRFLRLAWHAAYGQARMRKLKWDARSPALERYLSDPATTADSNDWLTELYLPVREN